VDIGEVEEVTGRHRAPVGYREWHAWTDPEGKPVLMSLSRPAIWPRGEPMKASCLKNDVGLWSRAPVAILSGSGLDEWIAFAADPLRSGRGGLLAAGSEGVL